MKNVNDDGITIEELGDVFRQYGLNMTNEELVIDLIKEGFLKMPTYTPDADNNISRIEMKDGKPTKGLTPKQTMFLMLYMYGYLPMDADDITQKKHEEQFEQFWGEIETGLIPYYVNHHFGLDLPIPGNQMLSNRSVTD